MWPFKEYNNQRKCADKSSLCHAPSYSMHFSKNGIVSACSFTRFMPQGKYPDQTIDEIWFGKRAREIRLDMKKREFPLGCAVCSSDAYAGNFGQMRSNLYERYAQNSFNKTINKLKSGISKGKFVEYPRVISFELSNTCNLECIMCVGLLSSSIRKNRDKLPPLPEVYDKEFLEQIKPYIVHLEEAKFFGGEPFLIDLYLDLWEVFIELNPKCKIYITTNGTILNNRVKSILEKLPNLQLVVSLDSITKPTYEKIRVNASFEKVMENVVYFNDVSKKHNRNLIISPTYMIHNWEEYPEILDFATKNYILFETNILTTPRELSLSNLTPNILERVKELWSSHSPLGNENNPVYSRNVAEFNKALRQVEFMLQEQKSYYNHPLGVKLAGFKPLSKMDFCLLIMFNHQIKATRDPSLPLRLLELWNSDTLLLNSFLSSLAKITGTLQQQEPSTFHSFNNELKSEIIKINDDEEVFVKQLLNNEEAFNLFTEHYRIKDLNKCVDILAEVNTNQKTIPVESDFF